MPSFKRVEQYNSAIKEISVFSEIPKHRNILEFIKAYQWQKDQQFVIAIVMEVVDNGPLDTFLSKNSLALNSLELSYVFSQCIIVFEWLSEQNIYHRDIKLDNLLIKNY